MTSRPALLALADQRLPSGGHVHSGGVEQAITDGLVTDVPSLATFLRRRVATSGLVAAALAAAAVRLTTPEVARADAEADARMPSPAQRAASRQQGRGLLRTARAIWPEPHKDLAWADLGPAPHHPIVLGCSARAAGLVPHDAALIAAYLSVTGPATAAQRLLGLDPIAVAECTFALDPLVDDVARRASAELAWAGLPADGDPMLDLLAERHAPRGDRLFAS